jgi:Xaa-Pro dipeptidase
MRLREAKDADEVAAVRAACDAVSEVMEEMFAELRAGAVEVELNAQVDYRLRRRGATATHPLVLFGPHAAQGHGTPDGRVLEPGQVVCADVSAQFDGYWGDLTRCASAGEPTDWTRAAWDVVVRAHGAAIEACRAGVPARDVDAAQRAFIEGASDLGDCLHGAGHAIGTEVHEPPFLIPSSDATLREGMIFTIEPGIYNSEIGGLRLEDDVLVGPDGPLVLSDKLPRELRILG